MTNPAGAGIIRYHLQGIPGRQATVRPLSVLSGETCGHNAGECGRMRWNEAECGMIRQNAEEWEKMGEREWRNIS